MKNRFVFVVCKFTDRMQPMPIQRNPECYPEIISLAAVAYDPTIENSKEEEPGGESPSFHTYIRPYKSVTPGAEKLHQVRFQAEKLYVNKVLVSKSVKRAKGELERFLDWLRDIRNPDEQIALVTNDSSKDFHKIFCHALLKYKFEVEDLRLVWFCDSRPIVVPIVYKTQNPSVNVLTKSNAATPPLEVARRLVAFFMKMAERNHVTMERLLSRSPFWISFEDGISEIEKLLSLPLKNREKAIRKIKV